MRAFHSSTLACLAATACGSADRETPSTECSWVFHADADGDAHGDANVSTTACTAPIGYTATADDCDDTNAAIHPGAAETCDGADEDCDEDTDEDAIDAPTWYADTDADGFGDRRSPTVACTQPAATSATDDDCNDHDGAMHPEADETCNEIDDDCDGLVDAHDTDLVGGSTWYDDDDGDGYGDGGAATYTCVQPEGTVSIAGDCNDVLASIRPDADETCNAIDDDCDALVDDDDSVADGWTWHADADGDGYGDPDAPLTACLQPPGFVYDDRDCDDAAADVGAAGTWYEDDDNDGWGNWTSSPYVACRPGPGWALLIDDCNENDRDVFPGATEVCNGIDDDCDGAVDVDDAGIVLDVWYDDDDGDGYGDDAATTESCDAVDASVTVGGDCDDDDATRNPGELEYCDGFDNNCIGVGDDDAVGLDWYADDDGDGYGDDGDVVVDCLPVSGRVLVGGDCNDDDDAISPAGTDVCRTGDDDDCDGRTDDCVIETDDVDFTVAGGEYCRNAGVGLVMQATDLDADGASDLLLGINCADTVHYASIVYGPVSGATTLEGAVELSYSGSEWEDFGTSMTAGDADSDGVDDAIVGARGRGAFVFLGPVTADSAEADVTFTAYTDSGYLGERLDFAPDADGDGQPDLVMSAPGEICSAPTGGSYAYCGYVYVAPAATGSDVFDVETNATYGYYGNEHDGDLGTSMAVAGDTNGDGLTDLAIGSDVEPDGALNVVHGGAAPGTYDAATAASAIITPSVFGPRLSSLEIVGADYDGDGTDDLIVGAHLDSEVYVFLGPVTGALQETDAAVTWWSGTRNSGLGSALAARDLDGDDHVDVLMAAAGPQEVFLQVGIASGSIDVDDLARFSGWGGRVWFGSSIAIVPDWTGDGLPEVAIGAPDWGENATGQVLGIVSGYSSEEIF
jgi:hypothetical protein